MLNKNVLIIALSAAVISPVTAHAQQTYKQNDASISQSYHMDSSWKVATLTRTSEKKRKVTIDGKRRESRNDVMDEALYEAAQKTLDINDTWFRVISRDVDTETSYSNRDNGLEARYERVPVRNCGLLGCTTEYRTERSTSFSARTINREETKYSVTLRFETGKGPKPSGSDVYYAKKVEQDLR